MFMMVWIRSVREERVQRRRGPLVPRGTKRRGGGLGGRGNGLGSGIVIPGQEDDGRLDEEGEDRNEWPELDEVLDPGEEYAEIIDEVADEDVELIEDDDTIDGELVPQGELGWEGSAE